ncbi:hypothetical protein T4B_11637 [Trichinella pseudospiralis]|uniref:Uncharacterized protein n=1 Tax=Trichinella pseudospiralis TaxID=6337 RepID=A0A0V1EWI0_TRIPS|nr:hypothetical protein T4A_10858 [Trichinella pseudospiralis]KRZ26640.1 hypothetical protein T4B_11637 [Trichinella pseudospiralis]
MKRLLFSRDIDHMIATIKRYHNWCLCFILRCSICFFQGKNLSIFAQIAVGYALQKGRSIAVAAESIMQFVGFLLLSGYYTILNENLF